MLRVRSTQPRKLYLSRGLISRLRPTFYPALNWSRQHLLSHYYNISHRLYENRNALGSTFLQACNLVLHGLIDGKKIIAWSSWRKWADFRQRLMSLLLFMQVVSPIGRYSFIVAFCTTSLLSNYSASCIKRAATFSLSLRVLI